MDLFAHLCFTFALLLSLVAAYNIQLLPSPKSDVADGLHWEPKTQSLYYADLGGIQPTLVRYDYRENRSYSARIRNRTAPASFIIPIKCKQNQFAVGVGRNIEVIEWDGRSPEADVIRTVVNVEPGDYFSTNFLNDGKADPHGRLYAGTLRALFCKDDPSAANATLFMYTKRDGLIRFRSDVFVSNGFTWNERDKKFYYIDSCKFDIKEYDWNPSTGQISNEKIAYDFRINGEFPGYTADGMTIDRGGLLWVGLFKGSSIVAIDPICHKVVENITIPARQVTAAVFGGPNLDEMFVTTAGKSTDLQTADKDIVPESPLSGHLFKITGLTSQGYAPYKLRCI